MTNLKETLLFMVMLWLAVSGLSADITEFYTFSVGQGYFTEYNGTPVPGLTSYDQLSAPIDIGFTFPFGINDYTQVRISSSGYIGLGDVVNQSTANTLSTSTYCPVLAPFWDDIMISTGNVEYALTGIAPDRIFIVSYRSIVWNDDFSNFFDFQMLMHENGAIAFYYNSLWTPQSTGSASIGINMHPGGSGNFFSITPANGTASTTVDNYQVNSFPAYGVSYSFTPVFYANDLAALSLSCNQTPIVGVESTYTVTVMNLGTSAQSNYFVRLMSGTNMMSSVSGGYIAPRQRIEFEITWTPQTSGETMLFGYVLLSGDTHTQNNMSNIISTHVQPAGTSLYCIGEGNLQTRIPFDFYYRYCLYETLYYPYEVPSTGLIHGIAYFNNFINWGFTDQPIQLWMGETDLADLEAGWVTSDQLTQVYNGTTDFPLGQNEIYIHFSQPYLYSGRNLVVLAKSPWVDTWPLAPIYFYCQEDSLDRARYFFSDTVNPDPLNPPVTAFVFGCYPRTCLYMIPVIANQDENNVPTAVLETYPNPFDNQITLRYSLSKANSVILAVYNLKGQLVKTLVTQIQDKGSHTITWNGRDENTKPVAPGVYFIRMQAGYFTSTRKVLFWNK